MRVITGKGFGSRGTSPVLKAQVDRWLRLRTEVLSTRAERMVERTRLAEGMEVIVSRGQLVEIGGSYRLPTVMERSNAILREVGTTEPGGPRG